MNNTMNYGLESAFVKSSLWRGYIVKFCLSFYLEFPCFFCFSKIILGPVSRALDASGVREAYNSLVILTLCFYCFLCWTVGSSCWSFGYGHNCHTGEVWKKSWLQGPGQQQLLPRFTVLRCWRPRLHQLDHWHGIGLQKSECIRAGSSRVCLQRCREVII